MTKRSLRQHVITRIHALGPLERARQEARLLEIFPNLPGFGTARTVLLYASHFPEEIDTKPWIDLAIRWGKRVVLPKIDIHTKRLTLHLGTETTPGTMGIPEPPATNPIVSPTEIDWVLVPGIAFDRKGYRLGRGGGFYDKLIPELRPACPRWGLILEPQWVEEVPIEPHDARVSGVASGLEIVAMD